ncbi:chromophore lyase CpcT/CpeT [Altererythrobacter sp. MF3-039]|uniref:chromophore lyase CpcT/CpeT n=1 Tax=Altererythrobacter sp. MF3-039 TaxID=3252901 RepID=UPI00390C9611
MIRQLVVTFFAAMAFANPATAHEAPPDPKTLEEQLELFLEWFPGRYDSAAQVENEVAAGVPDEDRNYRRYSIFRQVDLPHFDEITFYAEQRRWLEGASPEGEVYRQRIYVIAIDESEQAIRLTVHVPADQQSLLGAYRDVSLLADISPDDTTVWEGCDLFWRWHGDRFRGDIKPGACTFDSPAYGQEIVLEEYLVLARDEMHFADHGLSLDGEYLFGMRGEAPNISERISPLGCAFEGGEGGSSKPDCLSDLSED